VDAALAGGVVMTARRRGTFGQIRRDLYLTQRAMGTVQAAGRGPRPLAKRLVRRSVTRSLFRLFR
jgi:hypothetical protein